MVLFPAQRYRELEIRNPQSPDVPADDLRTETVMFAVKPPHLNSFAVH